ncbi:MAG: hypothetical protein Kow00121_64430 [Elainellaceae cyanobacterium]
MSRIKEQALRELGDQGADTLERYFAQIEYTAYWCIRMLIDAESIQAVIPEGGEDVVVLRRGIYELHQIKTRDESQDPWTTADVLPILCKQYYGRTFFSGDCCFHFVSDRTADTKTALKQGSYGSLFRLRFLLDLKHDGQPLDKDQQSELKDLEASLLPRIKAIMRTKHGEDIDDTKAILLLSNTWIETDNRILRTPKNVLELEDALLQALPGISSYTVSQLKEIYDRLILLVVRKIIHGKSREERRIERDDVLNCRVASCGIGDGYPELDKLPGKTPLEKKTLFGGFDPTELPRFRKQKVLAEGTIRRLKTLNLGNELERLTVAILDHHGECRQKICRELGVQRKPGPQILSMLRPELPKIARTYFPTLETEVDDQFCLGLLWCETNECSAWWHGLDDFDREAVV